VTRHEPTFDYDRLHPESVTVDAIEAARTDRLVPIISEYDGGIVAYALRGHEVALVAALNVPHAEVEYRQRQREADRGYPDD
jgi:hypothetical protein